MVFPKSEYVYAQYIDNDNVKMIFSDQPIDSELPPSPPIFDEGVFIKNHPFYEGSFLDVDKNDNPVYTANETNETVHFNDDVQKTFAYKMQLKYGMNQQGRKNLDQSKQYKIERVYKKAGQNKFRVLKTEHESITQNFTPQSTGLYRVIDLTGNSKPQLLKFYKTITLTTIEKKGLITSNGRTYHFKTKNGAKTDEHFSTVVDQADADGTEIIQVEETEDEAKVREKLGRLPFSKKTLENGKHPVEIKKKEDDASLSKDYKITIIDAVFDDYIDNPASIDKGAVKTVLKEMGITNIDENTIIFTNGSINIEFDLINTEAPQPATSGDPYVQPLVGRVYKLPVDQKIYRMLDATTNDGKKLVVNAKMWMPSTKDANFLHNKCVAFCARHGFRVPKRLRLVHTGMSFTRFVFAHFDDQWALVDLVTLKVLQQSDNCPPLSEAAPGCKANIEGLTDAHGMHVRTLTFRKDVQVHFSRFANPQVLTGVQLTLPSTLDTSNMAGCLVRQTVPEAIQLDELDNVSELDADAYQPVDLPRAEPEVFLTFQNQQLVNCVQRAL